MSDRPAPITIPLSIKPKGAARRARAEGGDQAWTDIHDALPKLRVVSGIFARGDAPEKALAATLGCIADITEGLAVAMLVNIEQFEAILGQDWSPRADGLLDSRVRLVVDGEVAQVIRDWEGNSCPVVLEHGARLVLPLDTGGVMVTMPGAGVHRDEDRMAAVEVLLDWAMGLVLLTTQLCDARRRACELEETRRRLREQTVMLTDLAVVDELTGLNNRRYLEQRVSYEVDRYRRYTHPLSLAIFDVDHFKRINDTYGHPVGDRVLKMISEVGRNNVRSVDLLARFGGEEFALLMPDTSREGSIIAVNRLLEAIRNASLPSESGPIRVTVSAGVSTLDVDWHGDHRTIVLAADQALYRAKQGGRDRFEQLSPGLHLQADKAAG